MKKMFSRIMLFWDEDKSLTVTLLLLLFFIFVLIPLSAPDNRGQLIIRTAYTFILVTAILSVAKNKKTTLLFSILGLAVFISGWFTKGLTNNTAALINDIGAILFNLIFAIVILLKTFKPGDITIHRIQGSIVVYVVFGLTFAYAFHLAFLLHGSDSFNNISNADIKQFFYFSFTTLTTMGYGDITPLLPIARSMANFEALIGQLYPAILIARLVSMEIETKRRK